MHPALPAFVLLFAPLPSALPQTQSQPQSQPAQSPRVRISGRVLDPEGAPVAGVTVSQYWSFDGAPRALGGSNDAEVRKTGADGRFEGTWTVNMKTFALLAMTADARLAALCEHDKVPEVTGLELRLQPAVKITGRFASEGLGYVPKWMNIYVSSPAKDARLGWCSTRTGEFAMVLPPGKVKLHAYGTDAKDRRWTLDVPAGETTLDLGVIDVEPTFFARHVGKELPPWNVTAARGLPMQTPTLADFAGRYVFLEFWGYWCGPCVGRGLPEMMKFADEHRDLAHRFQFLAFHDARAKTFAELDEKLVPIKQRHWGGKDLPFPILLDATGKTVREFGIRSFPTGVLIGPDGKLIGETGLKTLLELLRAESDEKTVAASRPAVGTGGETRPAGER